MPAGRRQAGGGGRCAARATLLRSTTSPAGEPVTSFGLCTARLRLELDGGAGDDAVGHGQGDRVPYAEQLLAVQEAVAVAEGLVEAQGQEVEQVARVVGERRRGRRGELAVRRDAGQPGGEQVAAVGP